MGFIQRRAHQPDFVQSAASRSASLAVTLDAATVAATATVAVSASLATTLGACSLTSTATSAVAATLASTLDSGTLAATGTVAVAATLAQTFASLVLTATGTTGGAAAPAVDRDSGSFVQREGHGGVWKLKSKAPWPTKETIDPVGTPPAIVTPDVILSPAPLAVALPPLVSPAPLTPLFPPFPVSLSDEEEDILHILLAAA